ncbi:hypothetical protein H6A66_09065 [Bacteroides caecigallinarum]|uniref:hypothetical protein n=1 Tax=Bacteroides caecigallinarum TaxID=1411144 RepID=UPI00195A88C8|nr:hypothetical protein [Bacteroides caecigallinarum]MBM6865314.1 hypothetical protein [Bacteroides caecigallinarum]
MKTEFKQIKILILFLALYAGYVPAWTQQIKLVSGRVLDKETKLPFKDEVVYVYAFNTVAAAVEAKKVIDSSSGMVFSDGKEIVDEGGYYEIRVAENGALIFKVGLTNAILQEVNYQMEINVFIDAGIVIDNIDVVAALQDIAPKEAAPTLIGNKLIMRNSFPIPAQFGKTNARLIIQPYVMVCDNQDTIAFTRPMVYDGEQYRMTQERRMLYNLKNDPLVRFAADVPLTENAMKIDWEDTVMVPDPTKNYYGNAIIQLEDYNMVYYNKLTKIISCEARRPLKFLEYSLDKYSLDFNDYKRRAKRELRNTAANVSLTFLVNKAEIDKKDPNNEEQLKELRNNLMNIINCEDCTLKEIRVTGVSSPEGNYQSNLALAQRRAVFAKNQLNRMLPVGSLSRTFLPAPDARVAEWSELIPVLKADSCFKEAEEILKIIEENPDSQQKQYLAIRKLPYYNTVVKEHLGSLRYMRFEYKHEIYRELTPEEILQRYETDEDYRTGKKDFALYEYWHLFQMVKDSLELENLYRRAYRASMETEGQPWILPANLLAVSYLSRDTVDTSILEPFIDRKTRGANVVRTRMDGVTKEIINPEAVVANQLSMYVKANNFEQASVMAQILPDTEKNALLKAYAMCLGGYYRGGNTAKEREEAKKTFELVKNSSPINKVVMHLAMDTKRDDAIALKEAANLPVENPITWYLKAIAYNRTVNPSSPVEYIFPEYCLIKCFSLDSKYIPIAETDGDIGKELFEGTMNDFETYKYLIDQYIMQYKL